MMIFSHTYEWQDASAVCTVWLKSYFLHFTNILLRGKCEYFDILYIFIEPKNVINVFSLLSANFLCKAHLSLFSFIFRCLSVVFETPVLYESKKLAQREKSKCISLQSSFGKGWHCCQIHFSRNLFTSFDNVLSTKLRKVWEVFFL